MVNINVGRLSFTANTLARGHSLRICWWTWTLSPKTRYVLQIQRVLKRNAYWVWNYSLKLHRMFREILILVNINKQPSLSRPGYTLRDVRQPCILAPFCLSTWPASVTMNVFIPEAHSTRYALATNDWSAGCADLVGRAARVVKINIPPCLDYGIAFQSANSPSPSLSLSSPLEPEPASDAARFIDSGIERACHNAGAVQLGHDAASAATLGHRYDNCTSHNLLV